MICNRFLIACAVFLTAIAATPMAASAHTRSESNSIWTISGKNIHVTFTIPDLEAKRLTDDGSMPASTVIGAYLAQHLNVTSRNGDCKRTDGPRQMGATQNFTRFEFAFVCNEADGLMLHDTALFEKVRSHTNFAQIRTIEGDFISQIFDVDHQELPGTASGASPLQNASFFDYIGMGIMHIFTGYDHQAFLLGLILLSRRVRDLIFVITGFTIGHSVTLALATLGVIRPHAEFIDSLVGLTIALVASENLANISKRPNTIAMIVGAALLLMAGASALGYGALPSLLLVGAAIFAANYLMLATHIADAGRLRLVVTMVFGLIHGFSFAANLFEMKLPQGRIAELLLGFNLGVEIGQLTVVFVILGFVAILRKVHLAFPRPIVSDVGTAGVCAAGLYWFVSRAFGA